MLLTRISTEALMDDPAEARQVAREQFLPRRKSEVEPITIVKTYVRDNVKYWEECTPDGIIVRISSREITHSAGV